MSEPPQRGEGPDVSWAASLGLIGALGFALALPTAAGALAGFYFSEKLGPLAVVGGILAGVAVGIAASLGLLLKAYDWRQ